MEMTLQEYLTAITDSKKRFGYIQISPTRRQAITLSRAKARHLICQVSDDAEITAEWASDKHEFLLIG